MRFSVARSIENRHVYVEQDDVEPVLGQPRQGFHPIFGLGDPVALRLQEQISDTPVQGIVVDQENMLGAPAFMRWKG